MLIFGEQHLCEVLAKYAAHCNTAWPHRALRLRPPRPTLSVPEPIHGRIRRQPILGGLLNEYEKVARNRWSGATAAFWNPARRDAAGIDRGSWPVAIATSQPWMSTSTKRWPA
jgi:hypothetical protein